MNLCWTPLRYLFDSCSGNTHGRWRPILLTTLLLAGGAGAAAPDRRDFDLQAHRGGRALAPENTLASFGNALALGVDTLELDIGLTSDGVVVVSHDSVLNPNHTRDDTGAWLAGPGPAIHALTLAQLQRYDVGRLNPGSTYGRAFARQQPSDGQRIPTLAAVFALVHARHADTVRFNIETKVDPTQPQLTAPPETMLRALLAEIEHAGMAKRVTIQSFDWRTLALAGQLAPQLPRAFLTSKRTLADPRWTLGLRAQDFGSVPQLVQAAAAHGGGAGTVIWSPNANELTPALLHEAHALGQQVLPWTVNRREDMARLIDWGVDGLITDEPDVLRALRKERGGVLPIRYAR